MRKVAVAFALLAVVGMCSVGSAQDERPDRGGRGRGGEDGQRGGGFRGEGRGGFGGGFGGRFQPPPNPVVEALDADKDGVISAKEIENAVAALKKLDKDNNGKLEGEEIQPPRPSFGGRGGFGGGPGGPGGRPGGGERGSMADRLLEGDKNNDGKLTKDELTSIPEAFRDRLMERADTNKDGVLDKSELEGMGGGRGGRGGEGRPGGGRPEGGRGGNRPARPEAE